MAAATAVIATAAIVGSLVATQQQVHESKQARRDAKDEQQRTKEEQVALEKEMKDKETVAKLGENYKRVRGVGGSGSMQSTKGGTLLTGPLGVTTPPQTSNKVLLGA